MSSKSDMLSSDHYEAIGRLAVACSKLDSLVTELIGDYVGIHVYHATVLIHHQQFANKIDTLLTILRTGKLLPDNERPLITVIKRAKEVYAFRSTLLHAIWDAAENGDPVAVRFQARGEFKVTRADATTQRIREFAEEAFEIADSLSFLREKLRETDQQLAKWDRLGA